MLGLALVTAGLLFPQSPARVPVTDTTQDGSTASEPFVVAPAVRLESAAAEGPPAADPPAGTGSEAASPGTSPRQPLRQAAAAGVPLRLEVPSLGVDAPVVGIGTTDGVLVPPSDPQTLGWWSAGARPGDRRGGALVTGHTVHTGGGAFDHLETLETGARVRVRTAAGVIDYAVSGVTVYRKASLAEDAERVFSQSVPGRLVLVTCEDWDGRSYLSNVVVFADPRP